MATSRQSKKYRDMMAELDTVMDKLQSDGLDVDAAVDLYEQGLQLTRQLTQYLSERENQLVELKKHTD